MPSRIILAALILVCSSCLATTADLTALANRIGARLENAEDREGAAKTVVEEIGKTVSTIEDRVETGAKGILGYGAAGDATTIAGLIGAGLHYLRNQTRKRDLEEQERALAAKGPA